MRDPLDRRITVHEFEDITPPIMRYPERESSVGLVQDEPRGGVDYRSFGADDFPGIYRDMGEDFTW